MGRGDALAFQHGHCRVVPADARHPAAATGTGTAQQDPIVSCRHSPAPGGGVEWFVVLGERPAQRAVEDVAAVIPSVCSRSWVVFASMHSRPDASSISTSWIGSARTELSEWSTADVKSSRSRSGSAPVASRCGACRPKTVRV